MKLGCAFSPNGAHRTDKCALYPKIVSIQYLYDIFTVLSCNIVTVFMLCSIKWQQQRSITVFWWSCFKCITLVFYWCSFALFWWKESFLRRENVKKKVQFLILQEIFLRVLTKCFQFCVLRKSNFTFRNLV